MESKCTLTNEELSAKVTAWAVELAKSGGTAWCLSVPVNFTKDPDVLIIECADRLKAADEQLAAKDKEIERLKQALRESYDDIVIECKKMGCDDNTIQPFKEAFYKKNNL